MLFRSLTLFLVFPGIIGMVLLLVSVMPRRKNLLLSLAAALFWLAIGLWWILGDVFTEMGLTGGYVDILLYIPFMFFVIILMEYVTRMNQVEISRVIGGRRFSEFGTPPKEYKSAYDEYKDKLYRRTRK